jgi:hypothetical protein
VASSMYSSELSHRPGNAMNGRAVERWRRVEASVGENLKNEVKRPGVCRYTISPVLKFGGGTTRICRKRYVTTKQRGVYADDGEWRWCGWCCIASSTCFLLPGIQTFRNQHTLITRWSGQFVTIKMAESITRIQCHPGKQFKIYCPDQR